LINKLNTNIARAAQTCSLPLFFDRDLEINPMTLKVEGDLDILKMYLHTENEAVSLRHSKLRALLKKIRKYVSRYVKDEGQIPPTSNHF